MITHVLRIDLGGMYSISGTSGSSPSPSTSILLTSACAGFGLGFRVDALFLLVLPFSSFPTGPGVWKAFAFALVVFAPNGARVLGPLHSC